MSAMQSPRRKAGDGPDRRVFADAAARRGRQRAPCRPCRRAAGRARRITTCCWCRAAFQGMNRVARSRAVHAALEAEFAGGMHALALTLRTPEEAAQSNRH